jgi:hypothetical protein
MEGAEDRGRLAAAAAEWLLARGCSIAAYDCDLGAETAPARPFERLRAADHLLGDLYPEFSAVDRAQIGRAREALAVVFRRWEEEGLDQPPLPHVLDAVGKRWQAEARQHDLLLVVVHTTLEALRADAKLRAGPPRDSYAACVDYAYLLVPATVELGPGDLPDRWGLLRDEDGAVVSGKQARRQERPPEWVRKQIFAALDPATGANVLVNRRAGR